MTNRSDAELNLWIAETLEPVGSLIEPTKVHTTGLMKLNYTTDGQLYWYSPLKCWWIGNGYGWTPKDFINDPACTVMPMKRPEFVSLAQLDDCDEGKWEACFCKHNEHSITCSEFAVALGDTLERAICKAFALAHGLEEK